MLDVDDVLDLGEVKVRNWCAYLDMKHAAEQEAIEKARRERR